MMRRSARTRRRILKRGVTEFPALLHSRRPGIRFTAIISASLVSQPTGAYEPEVLADSIRDILRAAAAGAVRRLDPVDLPAAQDACARSLRRERNIDDVSGLAFTAEVRLTLAPEDEEAVRDLLAASRAQSIAEALGRQRSRALAADLAHPAGVYTWWLQNPEFDLKKVPQDTELKSVADKLQGYPMDREEPLEVQILEILREFLNSFSRDEQKLLLMKLLADGMRASSRPHQAAAIEALSEELTATPDHVSVTLSED
ncbi:hypothetical protein AB0G83_06090 [Streptomyces klenkii]|uniref:hypothetical protein n=1 Tax=Streptomyces klenkii TaxID=1420899 RepID=UPI0033F92F81